MATRVTTFGGTYSRSPLPTDKPVLVRRLRCLQCQRTHAVLPACLFEQVRYTTHTLAPYFSSTSAEAIAVWQQSDSDGPEDISTLYRWLRRLRHNLNRLLPFLHTKYMELASAAELEAYQTAVLKTTPEPLAVCRLSWWLADQLLTVSGELLEQTPELSALNFLNTFCWQKTGRTLLSRPP